jgi:hypothetical protein
MDSSVVGELELSQPESAGGASLQYRYRTEPRPNLWRPIALRKNNIFPGSQRKPNVSRFREIERLRSSSTVTVSAVSLHM